MHFVNGEGLLGASYSHPQTIHGPFPALNFPGLPPPQMENQSPRGGSHGPAQGLWGIRTPDSDRQASACREPARRWRHKLGKSRQAEMVGAGILGDRNGPRQRRGGGTRRGVSSRAAGLSRPFSLQKGVHTIHLPLSAQYLQLPFV